MAFLGFVLVLQFLLLVYLPQPPEVKVSCNKAFYVLLWHVLVRYLCTIAIILPGRTGRSGRMVHDMND